MEPIGSVLTHTIFASFVSADRKSASTHRPTVSDVKSACWLPCQGLCVIHLRYCVLLSKRTAFVPSLLVMSSREFGVTEATAPVIRDDFAPADNPRTTSANPTNTILRARIA